MAVLRSPGASTPGPAAAVVAPPVTEAPDAPPTLPLPHVSLAGPALFRYVATKCGLLQDPFAGRVVARSSTGLYWFLAFLLSLGSVVPVIWGFVIKQYDRISPGVLGWVVARTRWLDRVYASSDAEQVVFLNAGFDFRPYRLSSPAGAALFEVDAPSAQSQKLSLLAALGGKKEALRRITFASVDLEEEAAKGGGGGVAAALASVGVDPAKRTLFLLEGSLNVMSRTAALATLEAAGKWPPGSALALTFISADVEPAPDRKEGGGRGGGRGAGSGPGSGYGAEAHLENRGPFAYFYPPGGDACEPWLLRAYGGGGKAAPVAVAVAKHSASEALEREVLARLASWPSYVCGKFRCMGHTHAVLLQVAK